MAVLKICGVCGREFLYNGMSIYKFQSYHERPSMLCCSYTCYMKEKRLREDMQAKIKEDSRKKARKKSV